MSVGYTPALRIPPGVCREMVSQLLAAHVYEAMMRPEHRVERCTRQRRHVSTHPHVWSSVRRFEVAEVVRLTEIVVRFAAHQFLDHAVRVLQAARAGARVHEPCQHSVPATYVNMPYRQLRPFTQCCKHNGTGRQSSSSIHWVTSSFAKALV